MEEVIALFGEFGTSVLQPGAVIGLAITVVLFILEVRWSRAHPPRSRRAEKAKALGHVVTARPRPSAPQQAGREGEGFGPCGDRQAGQILG